MIYWVIGVLLAIAGGLALLAQGKRKQGAAERERDLVLEAVNAARKKNKEARALRRKSGRNFDRDGVPDSYRYFRRRKGDSDKDN